MKRIFLLILLGAIFIVFFSTAVSADCSSCYGGVCDSVCDPFTETASCDDCAIAVIPEFTTAGAGIALLGAIAFAATRKRR